MSSNLLFPLSFRINWGQQVCPHRAAKGAPACSPWLSKIAYFCKSRWWRHSWCGRHIQWLLTTLEGPLSSKGSLDYLELVFDTWHLFDLNFDWKTWILDLFMFMVMQLCNRSIDWLINWYTNYKLINYFYFNKLIRWQCNISMNLYRILSSLFHQSLSLNLNHYISL